MTLKEALAAVVHCIPRGRVASYGQLAPMVNELSGKNVSAQMIGWQLSGMPKHERGSLPRWRVVSKQGVVSSVKLGEKGWEQVQLLEKEGIELKNNNVIDMEDMRWDFSEWRNQILK